MPRSSRPFTAAASAATCSRPRLGAWATCGRLERTRGIEWASSLLSALASPQIPRARPVTDLAGPRLDGRAAAGGRAWQRPHATGVDRLLVDGQAWRTDLVHGWPAERRPACFHANP